MKRLLAMLLCLMMALSLVPAAAAEDIEIIEAEEESINIVDPLPADEPAEAATSNGDVTINDTNFPDPNFREYVRDGFDENEDGVLSSSEIAAAVSMNYCCDLDLLTLKGIEYFTALEELNCSYNQLTGLDLSQNKALKYLNCSSNDLQYLNVSNNAALIRLDCSSNPLKSLDVSNNKALVHLACAWMELSSLDVSNNVKLEYLAPRSNHLTSLDVSKNTKLKDLNCYDNAIGTLDVSCCPELLFLITEGEYHAYDDSISYDYVYYMGEDGLKSHSLWFDKSTALNYKPTITTQPTSQMAAEGTTAQFTVKAKGASGYRWQWRSSSSGTWKDCTSATTGYNKATLQVSATAARNGYQYRCKVSNAAASVTSSTVTLTIASKPTITTQPKSVSAASGSTAKFTVAARGGGLSYQWQWRSSASGTWANCSSATTGYRSATLQVSATTARNGYQYRCKVTNAAGTTTSNTVTLTVVSKPTITTQPKSVSAASGSTAKFTVAASGGGLNYQWQWRSSSGGTWKDCSSATTGYQSATLQVSATTARNGYQYRCKVTNIAGTATSGTATLTVTSGTSKPTITTQPKSQTVAAGTAVTFKVVASGATSYQWQFRTSSTGEWGDSTATGCKTATLTITAETWRSGYQYRCKVTNSNGTTISSAATLTVSDAGKPTITTQPKSQTVSAGTTVSFKVVASGATSYQWQFRTSSAGQWGNCTSTGAQTATLTITAETWRSGYQYRCLVTNGNGTTTSGAATLTVS